MVNVVDRIRLSSTKGRDRDGVVAAVTGPLVRVRWPSDEETTIVPAPGTLTVLAAAKATPSKAAKDKGAAKGNGAAKHEADAKEKATSKRATPKKKSGARKTQPAKRPLR